MRRLLWSKGDRLQLPVRGCKTTLTWYNRKEMNSRHSVSTTESPCITVQGCFSFSKLQLEWLILLRKHRKRTISEAMS